MKWYQTIMRKRTKIRNMREYEIDLCIKKALIADAANMLCTFDINTFKTICNRSLAMETSRQSSPVDEHTIRKQ
ncbi:MAG: hypothetical protein LBN22_12010 [Clostridiales Family XIII bacterium]|jgi:hypothetical protein|nr:hypothetical protein [Clostridiales Family XIII bacterium]